MQENKKIKKIETTFLQSFSPPNKQTNKCKEKQEN
jgi:hypothetical protein